MACGHADDAGAAGVLDEPERDRRLFFCQIEVLETTIS